MAVFHDCRSIIALARFHCRKTRVIMLFGADKIFC
jgi:hypothetical protein